LTPPVKIGWTIRSDLALIVRHNQQIQSNPMSIKLLGDLMFPRLAPWQRRKQARIMVWVVATSVFLGALIVGIMFLVDRKH
jgi:hypothetical protein